MFGSLSFSNRQKQRLKILNRLRDRLELRLVSLNASIAKLEEQLARDSED